jgi:hypothetical protein
MSLQGHETRNWKITMTSLSSLNIKLHYSRRAISESFFLNAMTSLVLICKLLLAFVVGGTSSLLQTSAFVASTRRTSGTFVVTSSIRRWQQQQESRESSASSLATTRVTARHIMRLDATSQQGKTTNSDEDDYDLKSIKIGDRDFWTRQKELIDEMSNANEASVKAEMQDKFSKRRLGLVGDTAYFGFFIFCLLWITSENPFVAISYSFGATMGLAYAYGLGKYVETVGASPEEVISSQGAGVGGARFAFLILLLIIVVRFRSEGLLEVPAIAGFFTYQLASLSQGFKEIND